MKRRGQRLVEAAALAVFFAGLNFGVSTFRRLRRVF
jgi:hypothetical protein